MLAQRCAAVTIASSKLPVDTIGAVASVIECVKPSIAATRAKVSGRGRATLLLCASLRWHLSPPDRHIPKE